MFIDSGYTRSIHIKISARVNDISGDNSTGNFNFFSPLLQLRLICFLTESALNNKNNNRRIKQNKKKKKTSIGI